jgi:hypothetical protein
VKEGKELLDGMLDFFLGLYSLSRSVGIFLEICTKIYRFLFSSNLKFFGFPRNFRYFEFIIKKK